jgi:AcrR family transcriptional regulator
VSFDVRWEPEVPLSLPRGRHNLPAEVVRASQRQRLLRAMLEHVAEYGYEDTTVPKVVASARVSRNAFYDLFSDKTDCFLALCDELAEEIIEELTITDVRYWVEALRIGLRRYLRWWEQHPEFSRTYFVELPSAGRRAVEQRDRQYARFRALFEELGDWARLQQPELQPLNPLAARALVVATTELIGEEVRAGRTDRLTDLEDGLLFFMVKELADDETALAL